MNKIFSSGYIALITTIVLSLVLISISLSASMATFFDTQNTASAEFKADTKMIAESCINQAIEFIGENHLYAVASGTLSTPFGTCILTASPSANQTFIQALATSSIYSTSVSALFSLQTSTFIKYEESSPD